MIKQKDPSESVEEMPRKEQERMKDLWNYAKNPREQRYWEIYWANKNLLPAAIRELYGKRRFKEFKLREKTGAKYFNPDDVQYFETGEYIGGPADWLRSHFRRWTLPEIDAGASGYPPDKEHQFRLEKEQDAETAIEFIRNKYFGKRFNGEKHSQRIDEILGQTMYGIDLHLVDLVRMVRALQRLIELKEVKKSPKWQKEIDKALENIAWQITMARKADELRDVDVLELSGKSWEQTKRFQKLAALGPRAMMNRLRILDNATLYKLREDRRFYKQAELAKAIAHIQLEAILKALGKSLEPEEQERGMITSGRTVAENPTLVVARALHEELRKIAKEEGKERFTPEDIKRAMRAASARIRAEQLLKSVKTPYLLESALMGEVAKFYEEYTKRFGRPPIILDESDAKDVLRNMADYLEHLVVHGPKHYFKGYVLGLLKRAKV